MSDLKIRFAQKQDCALILQFIRELAVYEKLEHDVVATAETLEKAFFVDKNSPEVILGEYDGKAVAFAIFFHNFSSFLGVKGLYLEDLFVKPEYRGSGFGKKMLLHLVGLAKERNCGRMEWSVLDWNQPAIDFYKSLGAKPMDEWTVFRLTRDAIDKLV